jgi:hypothetical protein
VSLRDQVTTARAAMGVAASLIAALLWLFTIHATAQSNKTDLRSAQEQLEILTDIHQRQDAADEAKRKLTLKLCAEGSLVGPRCCAVGSLRGCPPPPPHPRPPSGGP